MTTHVSHWKRWWTRSAWDRFVHVVAAAAFLLAVGTFLELAAKAPEGAFLPLEDKFMQALRPEGHPYGPSGTVGIVRDLTALGSAVVLTTMTLLILGYLLMRRLYRVAALIAVATIGGQLLNVWLKATFSRERPAVALRLVEASSTSFPSGHTMASSIFYLTMGALLARTARRRREKAYFVACALLLTSVVGFSRVYLGVHYPTDVIAGWSAGIAWALICWFVADWLGRHGRLREETGEPRSV